MKKIVSIMIFASVLVLALAGCGKGNPGYGGRGDADPDSGSNSGGFVSSGAAGDNDYVGRASFGSVTVGGYVTFGAYEQDNNVSNGKEDIEWLVLDVQNGRALLISKYALDCQPYNTAWTDVTWETCTLRQWVNGAFLNTAFSSTEKSKIISSTVTADKNPHYKTSSGADTTDKVFLLSIKEVNEYFKSDEARKCVPTDYAIAQGVRAEENNTTGGRVTCRWWLRSPGGGSNDAASVNSGGAVVEVGDSVNNSHEAVRPALWINL